MIAGVLLLQLSTALLLSAQEGFNAPLTDVHGTLPCPEVKATIEIITNVNTYSEADFLV